MSKLPNKVPAELVNSLDAGERLRLMAVLLDGDAEAGIASYLDHAAPDLRAAVAAGAPVEVIAIVLAKFLGARDAMRAWAQSTGQG